MVYAFGDSRLDWLTGASLGLACRTTPFKGQHGCKGQKAERPKLKATYEKHTI